jgi:hypothetical protein
VITGWFVPLSLLNSTPKEGPLPELFTPYNRIVNDAPSPGYPLRIPVEEFSVMPIGRFSANIPIPASQGVFEGRFDAMHGMIIGFTLSK